MKILLLLLVCMSCRTHKPTSTDTGAISLDWFFNRPFKEYGDVWIENYQDSCLTIKTHPPHEGICYLVSWQVFDSCGRRIAYGCTDGKVLDTNYNRCAPCDSAYYKYMYKEHSVEKYFNQPVTETVSKWTDYDTTKPSHTRLYMNIDNTINVQDVIIVPPKYYHANPNETVTLIIKIKSNTTALLGWGPGYAGSIDLPLPDKIEQPYKSVDFWFRKNFEKWDLISYIKNF